jgi:ADP-heptose:LPS heptosyltransferase
MSQLDLIVSVDTSVVHLAGAMDIPVWVMLQCTPDFRWLLDGETTPWYPSMRLIRQKTFGVWGDVIERIASELENFRPSRKSGN